MTANVTIRIIVQQPPVNVYYALQKGSGSNFEVEQIQLSTGQDLTFTCEVKVKDGKDGNPDFAGPFVQGPVSERFVYIGIGTFAGHRNATHDRRLKVPFRGITPHQTELLAADKALVLEAKFPGKDKFGAPACATVKPFLGWEVVGYGIEN